MPDSDKHLERINDLEAELARLIAKVKWAYNDAIYTAPEDTARMNRQWRVMTDAAVDAEAILKQPASTPGHSTHKEER